MLVKSLRRAACLVAFLAGLAPGAQANPPSSPGAVRSLLEMRHEGVVTQQFDLSCGAAAVTTILRYQFGGAVTEREVATSLINRPEYIANPELVQLRQGFSLLDLKRFVDARGYEGVGLGQMTLATLLARAPAITPISTTGYDHFVVVRGRMGDRVLIAASAWGNRTMTVDDFERAWIDYGGEIGHVAFLVTRGGEVAPPGRLAADARHFFTFN